jgi:hypothetical protein
MCTRIIVTIVMNTISLTSDHRKLLELEYVTKKVYVYVGRLDPSYHMYPLSTAGYNDGMVILEQSKYTTTQT